jgi:hypothetical protein
MGLLQQNVLFLEAVYGYRIFYNMRVLEFAGVSFAYTGDQNTTRCVKLDFF